MSEGADLRSTKPMRASPRRGVWAAVGAAALAASLAVVGFVISRPPWQGPPTPATPQAPAAADGLTPWPADYPPALRQRQPGEWVKLLRVADQPDRPPNPARGTVWAGPGREATGPRFQPLWCRRLAGTGQYLELPDGLQMTSSFPEANVGCTALALEDDPAPGWFELEANVSPSQGISKEQIFGIFFGWQAVGTDQVGAYFLGVDDRPPADEPAAKARLLVNRLVVPAGAGGPDLGGVSRAALRRAPLAEGLLARRDKPYRLRVRAEPGKVVIEVDGGQPLVLPDPPDPRGALGVWVQGGIATFGQTRTRTLPPQALDE